MRIVFMGTPAFAVPSLERMIRELKDALNGLVEEKP